MIKQVCSRCDREVSAYYSMRAVRGFSVPLIDIDDYNLCKDCWNDFMRFLEQKPQLKQEEK